MRRQCRRFEFQRILLPVRMRIHWGMGRFWAIFFASVRFVRKVLCDGCGGARRVRRRGRAGYLSGRVCAAFDRLCVALAGPSIRGVGGETRRPAALFWRRPVRRSAAPLGRGARKSQGFLRDDAAVRVSRWAQELLARGPRAARSLCKNKS